MAVKKKKIIKKTDDLPTETEVVATESVSVVEESVGVLPQLSKEEHIPKHYDEDDNLSWKKVVAWMFGILLLIGVLAGSILFAYQQGEKFGEDKIRSQIAKTPTPTVTPTPEPPKLSAYAIKVLNGSGIIGEAARAKTLLEKAGYKVSDIGNASSSATNTLIEAKEKVSKGWVNNLRVVLEQTYALDDPKVLNSNSENDVIVTVGSKKAP